VDNHDELISLFAESVATALREMAGVDAILSDTKRSNGNEILADIAAILPLTTSTGTGQLIISLPRKTAVALTQKVMNREDDMGMVHDLMGEMANVIAGQAKARLFGSPAHFKLSTPRIVADGRESVTTGQHLLRFKSEVGEFILYLDLPS
jgi:CheY-specific phosphatase CheX